jgi:hypothetical protein
VALRSLIACSALIIAIGVVKTSVQASSAGETTPFLYTLAKAYEPLAWMHGGERFPSGATVFISNARGKQPLLPDFAASADAAVSFDGKRVLFAGKKNVGDLWQIWEIALDGSALRPVTTAEHECIRPFYLPDDHVAYACRCDGFFTIEAADLAGGKPLALTYGPANFLPTDVLHDGRILFEAGYPLGSETKPEIYTVYSDGSGVESYRCDHGDAHHQGRQLGSGDIVFASRSGLSRFTSARAQEVRIAAPVGEYAGDVAELPSGDWLVPWRLDSSVPFRLEIWSVGAPILRQELAEENANVIQPVLLDERAVPNRHPSGLHDWPNANLLCLNAYTSKYSFPPGAVQSVRLYARGGQGDPQLLGTAAVERDGSFFVQVPSEQALQIELLDSTGKTLKRESGFFWMRRGEQRVCVGCHAGPETAPENAVPQILLRSTTPADMTGAPRSSGGH